MQNASLPLSPLMMAPISCLSKADCDLGLVIQKSMALLPPHQPNGMGKGESET